MRKSSPTANESCWSGSIAARGAERHPVFHVWYQNLAVNYIELTRRELADGSLHEAEDSLRSLASVLPQLLPEDRVLAEEKYRELRDQLQSKLAAHQ